MGRERGERDLDGDLEGMSREEVVEEARKLRRGIRRHRDSSGHELCWHQPDLWALLPEGTEAIPAVPEWPVFLRGCIRYRQSLDEQLPGAPRTGAEHHEGAVGPTSRPSNPGS